MRRIYLDHNATTPLDPLVLEAMLPWLDGRDGFGNPSSIHLEGRRARAAIDEARQQAAALWQAREHEIVFTGSGTEANNLAIWGLAWAAVQRGRARHIVVSAIEHHAVLHAAEMLASRHGFRLDLIPVDNTGRCDLEALSRLLRPDTALCSVMSANNETGTLQPLEQIGALCASRGVLFHVDAVQSAGKESVELAAWQATSAAVSAHKFYGPKGAGLLWVAGGQSLTPLLVGGAQENQRRAGTENTAAIVGTAAALILAEDRRHMDMPQYRIWTEQIWRQLSQSLTGLKRNGHPDERVANTLHISVSGVNGEDLLMAADLEGLSLSSGSACMVGSVKPSHVITALGGDPTTASLRISLGRLNTADDVPEITSRLTSVINRLRGKFA